MLKRCINHKDLKRLTKLSNNEFTDDFKRGDVLVIDEDGLLDGHIQSFA